MLEIKSAHRAETQADVFLKLAPKYRRYRDRCREMHAQLRAGGNAQSLKEELEKRDEDLMRSIPRCSELEGMLRAKDDELEVGKRVAEKCEDLQANVLSLRAELEQNATRVADLSAEWTEKVTELERKVAELERPEGARVVVLARVAALEDTIRVLRSEREAERAKTTLKEARLVEWINELEWDSSKLGDQVVALEAEKAQLLDQGFPQESASAAVPRRLHSRLAYGYDPATPEAGRGAEIEDDLPSDNDDAGEDGGGDEAE
ncbi:uncharacterized protein [Nicotiana sylvestris]|uniref:uncharacterized protein n=1 Tax=Nicotiana sylvestris TaxID=4096 RepID=UPI00388CBF7D